MNKELPTFCKRNPDIVTYLTFLIVLFAKSTLQGCIFPLNILVFLQY